jgi:choline-glycine betaine transporter
MPPAGRRNRRKQPDVPAPVRETLLWGCFGAVLALGVLLASGAPFLAALAAAAGLLSLAFAAYAILRITGMRLDHLHHDDPR